MIIPKKEVIYLGPDTIHTKTYKSLIGNHGSELLSLSLDDKCSLYFNQLYQENPNWAINNLLEYDYDKSVSNEEQYKQKIFDEMLKKEEEKTKAEAEEKAKKEAEEKAKKEAEEKAKKEAEEKAEEEAEEKVKKEAEEKAKREAALSSSLSSSSSSLPSSSNTIVVTKAKRDIKDKTPTEEQKAALDIEYKKKAGGVKEVDEKIMDAITHLRIYSKCFLKEKHIKNHKQQIFPKKELSNTNSTIIKPNQKQLKKRSLLFGTIDSDYNSEVMCHDSEIRLFPWLSGQYPIFTRWDGKVYQGIPNIESIMTTGKDKKRIKPNTCYMEFMRKSFNGKGIVFSISNSYVNVAIKLISVLRALDNKLPIEFVHDEGELNDDSKQRLIDSGRNDIILTPEITQLLKNLKPGTYTNEFPKQEIWFVDVTRAVSKDYREGIFVGFSKKLLATIFSSFDETLLVDADTVLLIPPEQFFELDSYKETGAVFYKDREIDLRIGKSDTDFFRSLLPTQLDSDIFGIPLSTNFTLNNRYLGQGFEHLQESGVVAIKRSNHFSGLLIATQLVIWIPSRSRVWGDKELFWLGQSIAGNENYHFNRNAAGAVGEISKQEYRPNSKQSIELCSTHPAHVSDHDDHTLLWINSGFQTCKLSNAAEKDLTTWLFKDRFVDVEQLRNYYESPLKIEYVLIPPDGGIHIKSPPSGEPDKSWRYGGLCFGHSWCSYDVIGPGTPMEKRGNFIKYNKHEIAVFDYLGAIWAQS